jgi:hypothetical protein
MKDNVARLGHERRRLAQQLPDVSIALTGSLLSRLVRCNKAGCRLCQNPKHPGHGPIWILSVSLGSRRVRQITIPKQFKPEVEAGLRRFAEIQTLLKKIAKVNQELIEERKRA